MKATTNRKVSKTSKTKAAKPAFPLNDAPFAELAKYLNTLASEQPENAEKIAQAAFQKLAPIAKKVSAHQPPPLFPKVEVVPMMELFDTMQNAADELHSRAYESFVATSDNNRCALYAPTIASAINAALRTMRDNFGDIDVPYEPYLRIAQSANVYTPHFRSTFKHWLKLLEKVISFVENEVMQYVENETLAKRLAKRESVSLKKRIGECLDLLHFLNNNIYIA